MRPAVMLFKDRWLPASETFIRAQQTASGDAVVECLGLQKSIGPLARDEDRIIFRSTPLGHVQRRIFVATGRHPAVSRALSASGAQIVHAHFMTSAMLIQASTKRARLPLVITVHGRDLAVGLTMPGARGRRWRRRAAKTFSAAALVIAVSEQVRQNAVALGCAPSRVVVHHIGVPIGPPPSPRERKGILAVGRFVDKKGFLDLIQAVGRLPDGPDRVLTVIGEGPDRQQMVDHAREAGIDLRLPGTVDNDAVRSALRSAAVFAAPSRTAADGDQEGLPTVLVEAAASGCAIVATRHAGIPEIVIDGETGLLVEERDVVGLTGALTRVLEDPDLRERLGRAARAKAEAEFDVVVQTEQLLRLYEAVGSRSARLRVVHLDHSGSAGGAELALARVLTASHPWSGTVLLPRGEEAAEGAFADVASRVRAIGPMQPPGATTVGGPRSVLLALRMMGQALTLALNENVRRADLVHANSSRAAVYGAAAALVRKKRLVVHLRDLVDPTAVGRGGYFLLTRLALRRAAGVVANSRTTLESARHWIGASTPTAVIGSPLGLARASRPPRPEVRRIGMVARLDPWKGQLRVLDAFAAAFPAGDVRLVLAGGTPFGKVDHRREIEDRARQLGIADRIDLLGHVEDVARVIDELDICIQASERPEPLGQNVLQYLARGSVIVASAEGGPTEWIRNGVNGVLFEPRNTTALTDALLRLAADHALRVRLSEGASATADLPADEDVAQRLGEFFAQVRAS